MAINPFKSLSLFVFIFLFVQGISAQVVYVNHAATGANNGTSWTNAYKDLQDALANTTSGQIWVARGTYYPTSGTDQNISFPVVNVELYGGFVGNETSISQRNTASNSSRLSGEIGTAMENDNSYTVVGPVNNAVVDGFRIYGGRGWGAGSAMVRSGAGVYVTGNSEIRNCEIFDNKCLADGGGIWTENGLKIIDCLIYNNEATNGGGAAGTGTLNIIGSGFLSNEAFSNGGGLNGNGMFLTVNDSGFSSNVALPNGDGGGIRIFQGCANIFDSRILNNSANRGGGIHIFDGLLSVSTMENTTFSNNSANVFGGGISLDVKDINVTKCIFVNNHSGVEGSALFSESAPLRPTKAILENCLLYGNSVNTGGAIYLGTSTSLDMYNSTLLNNGDYLDNSIVTKGDPSTIWNSILWGNGQAFKSIGGVITVHHSIVENGYPCTNCPNGNGNIYPEFTDSSNIIGPDLIYGTQDDGTKLGIGSPAINAGAPSITTPTTDITGKPRIGVFDLGAYERCYGDSILYVNHSATGNDDGSSWANAKNSLSDALLLSKTCGDIKEIWVAAGTYIPEHNIFGIPSTGKETTFLLSSNLSILGGFDGTETDKNQRDPEENICILSADLLQNDNGFSNNGENSWTIITGKSLATFLLDGFTIQGANSVNEAPVSFFNSTGKLSNLIIKDNIGQYVFESSSSGVIIMDQCKIIDNVCGSVVIPSIYSISNSFIHNNQISSSGDVGAVNNCVISNSVVSNTKNGGAGLRGNGIVGGIVTNCTVVSNAVGVKNATIKNSILWDNEVESTNSTVTYSNVEGITGGTGNINSDPEFVNLSDPDGVDNIGGTLDDGVAILYISPAKDASDPNTMDPNLDITGDSREGVFDIGAYEVKCSNGLVYFVNAQASGNYAGNLWANADTSLAHAIYLAKNCDIVEEIWVAEGTYWPEGVGPFPDPDQRNHTFELGDSISIYGGFDGTESQLSERDYVNHPTILSGDFNDDDIVNGLGASLNIFNNSENAYSVISVFNKQNIVLDGITVKGGNSPFAAGGIFMEDSNVEIRNSIFEEHYSDFTGAALYADNMASIRLVNCIFRKNKSLYQESDIYMGYGSNLLVKDCWLYR